MPFSISARSGAKGAAKENEIIRSAFPLLRRERRPDLKRYAVAQAGVASALENDAELMPSARIAYERMHSHTIENNRRTPALAEADVQAADGPKAIFECAISDACVWRYRQACFVPQIFAQRSVIGLTVRRADTVRACAENQSRSLMRFRQRHDVCERRDFSGKRIILDSGGKARMKPVSESIAPACAVYLIGDQAHAESPFVCVCISRPAHGATFARSERSTRHTRSAGGPVFRRCDLRFGFPLRFHFD